MHLGDGEGWTAKAWCLAARSGRLFAFLLAVGCTTSLPACDGNNENKEPPMGISDQELAQDLAVISRSRIFFGHQSVGVNLLEGMRDLLEEHPGTSAVFCTMGNEPVAEGPVLVDSFIGTNGDPLSKCEAFEQKIRTAHGAFDLAVMKYCYVDFTPTTDVRAALQRYHQTVDSLRVVYPHLALVHVTVPLRARKPLWKRAIKSVLGRADSVDLANAVRSQYNSMLRATFAGEPIFDLAAVESEGGKTDPPSLRSDYTYDGGHLNEHGRKAAARVMVHALAQALRLQHQ